MHTSTTVLVGHNANGKKASQILQTVYSWILYKDVNVQFDYFQLIKLNAVGSSGKGMYCTEYPIPTLAFSSSLGWSLLKKS